MSNDAVRQEPFSVSTDSVSTDEGIQLYSVVINDEEQYSIWLVDRDLPAG